MLASSPRTPTGFFSGLALVLLKVTVWSIRQKKNGNTSCGGDFIGNTFQCHINCKIESSVYDFLCGTYCTVYTVGHSSVCYSQHYKFPLHPSLFLLLLCLTSLPLRFFEPMIQKARYANIRYLEFLMLTVTARTVDSCTSFIF